MTDAKFVDIVHSDSGFFGTSIECGTVDIYPNSGSRIQPGCKQTFPEDVLGMKHINICKLNIF